MRKAAIVALIATTLTGGCASGLPGLRPLTYQQPSDTRIYASYAACPHRAGKDFAPFLAAIALEVGSKLISGFGTALAKGSEGGALPASVATTNVEIGKELPKCLVVIRGRFSPSTPGEKPTPLPPTPDKLTLRDPAGKPISVDLPTVYGLQHYIEIQLDSSQNRTAMTFGPAILYIAQSMDGATKGDRAISIAVKFERPGHDPLGSVVLISNRQIGDMKAYEADASQRMHYEAPWFASIASADGTAEPPAGDSTTPVKEGAGDAPAAPAGGQIVAAVGMPVVKLAPAKPVVAKAAEPAKPVKVAAPGATADTPATPNGPTPYTITATVIETRPTKEFLAFVASVFSGVEPQLNDALKNQIDPATRATNAGTDIDHQSAYVTAYATAQGAMYAYCALPAATAKGDLITKSAAARVGQLGANKAAIAADLNAPYAQLIDVSTADPATIAACSAYQ